MLTTLLVVAVVCVAVLLALALADRLSAGLAERRATAYLADSFGSPPAVRVHGSPFLTQVLRGCYREVEVSGGGVRIGELTGATLHARLHNVHLPARALVSDGPTELVCERLTARVVLPYGELSRISRVPGLALSFDDGRLVASAALPVPGISQIARVSGEARLRVAGTTVWLQVSRLSVAGLSLTSLVMKQLLPVMNVPIPLPALPWGLRLDDLVPQTPGLVVHGSAAAIVLRAPSVS